ncbi:MAG: heparinase II/III family protein [Bryobacteraceae bacterium]|nr:heparinase II/III family protein [Bryobacteraceae bacterium]
MTRREFAAAPAVLPAMPVAGAMQAPPERNLISGSWDVNRVAGALLPRAQWQHFPRWRDRARWEGLAGETRRGLVTSGERHLGAPWTVLPASVFLDYSRDGNRSRYEGLRSARRGRLQDLVFAELAEGKGRFVDEIVNGVWATCEETYWGVPAHVGVQKAGTGLPDVAEPTVDLFAADTAATLSWIHYLMAEKLDEASPLVSKRIVHDVQAKVLTPCYLRNDFWWMGFGQDRAMNNWTPWICSNWLTAALLMEGDERRRAETVQKAMRSIDRFLDGYHEDGGCDEGPSYWGHAGGSLFECLELLDSASAGKMDFFGLPLVGEIGRYIYRAHVAGDWYVNFADASPRIQVYGELIYRYGKRIKDEKLIAQGGFGAATRGGRRASGSLARTMDGLMLEGEMARAPKTAPLVGDVWLQGTHVFVARQEEGSTEGLYLAAQGGHNAESHNHNDVGNFIVYASGKPVLIDAGVETYTAKTFSSRRYEIWTMRSSYHNLPTVNGVEQAAGRRFEALDCRAGAGERAEFSLNIARAYPAEAGISEWRRTISLDRGQRKATVVDEARFTGSSNRVEFTLMTPCAVTVKQSGVLALDGGAGLGGKAIVRHDAALAVKVEEIAITDGRLKPIWGEKLYRIQLSAPRVAGSGRWAVEISEA